MSLPRRPRPPLGKIWQPPSITSTHLDEIDPKLGKQATMTLEGKEYDVSGSDLKDLASLGCGQYGYVRKMRHRQSEAVIAVKKIRLTDDPEERKRMSMDWKVNTIHGGKCPYLVRCFGALRHEEELLICMEVMDTSLEMFYKRVFRLQNKHLEVAGITINQAKKQKISSDAADVCNPQTPTGELAAMPETHIAYISFAIVNGLQFLKKEMNVMHRDVKPSNVLLSQSGEVKLCDFGISGDLIQSKAKTRNVGCSLYMAPERVDPSTASAESCGFDVRSDVWSIGITLIEVATGRHPYAALKNAMQQMTQLVKGSPPNLPEDRVFSKDFRDFVAACCKREPQNRPKYEELLKYGFISILRDAQEEEGAKKLLSKFIERTGLDDSK